MAVLINKSGQNRGEHLIASAEYVLGRHADCDLNELFIGDARVSRRHARILQEGSTYFIEDLGSHNGTFVNGVAISERKPLVDGDRIGIASMEFAFHLTVPERPESKQSSVLKAKNQTEVLEDSRESSILARADISLAGDSLGSKSPDSRKLQALLEMLRNLGTSFDIDVVLDKLLDGLFHIFPNVDRAFVGLKEDEDDTVTPRAVRYRRPNSNQPMTVSRTIVQKVISSGHAILCSDAESDARFVGSQSILEANIRSFMCAPLIDTDGNAWGMIQLDALNQFRGFTEEDLQVLASVAPQAGIAVKYTQIHQRELQQRTLIYDLEVAKRVQQTLLPPAPPNLDGYEFFAHYESARHIGGDYYDYVPLPDGRLAVVVADVAGKGVSAALVMAKLSGELKTYLLSELSHKAAIGRMNQSLGGNDGPIRLVTLALAVFDPATHTVEIVNAGHVMPLLRRSTGGAEAIGDETCGIPLGVMPEFEYEDCQITINPGETMVFVTDGITEAGPSETELYGLERLRQKVECEEGDLADLARNVLSDVSTFVDGRPQSDDICMLCVRRLR